MNVIETSGLGKRYGSTWALRECTVALPAGHLAALVGPNGAGKTTLMNMAVGLTLPTAGTATVLGGQPAGSRPALDAIAFVAQDAPVYRNLSAGDMLHLTRNLNRRFDHGYARARLADLGIPLGKKAGKLSGGQQAQLALTLALARRPRLLVLDEPLAMLDPLARRDFMAAVLTAMADDGLSSLLSSHALAELERVADDLACRPAAGNSCPARSTSCWPTTRSDRPGRRGGPLCEPTPRRAEPRGVSGPPPVRTGETADPASPGWGADDVSLEELVLATSARRAALYRPVLRPFSRPSQRRRRDDRCLPCPRSRARAPLRGPCPSGGRAGSPVR